MSSSLIFALNTQYCCRNFKKYSQLTILYIYSHRPSLVKRYSRWQSPTLWCPERSSSVTTLQRATVLWCCIALHLRTIALSLIRPFPELLSESGTNHMEYIQGEKLVKFCLMADIKDKPDPWVNKFHKRPFKIYSNIQLISIFKGLSTVCYLSLTLTFHKWATLQKQNLHTNINDKLKHQMKEYNNSYIKGSVEYQ